MVLKIINAIFTYDEIIVRMAKLGYMRWLFVEARLLTSNAIFTKLPNIFCKPRRTVYGCYLKSHNCQFIVISA